MTERREDATMQIADFPSLERAATRRGGGYLRGLPTAINYLNEGVAAGAIRNARLNDAKSWLSTLIWDAWRQEVSPKIDRNERTWSEPLRKLFDNLYLSGLNDIMVANKKLAKTKATGEEVETLRAFVNEVLPLAQAAQSLKANVLKGREPSKEPPKPVNPNKIVKQCPCCYRDIAVGPSGKMVHHGYDRPGHGHQTASCWGIDFEPLQVSTKGLEYVIAARTVRLTQDRAYRETLNTATEVSVWSGLRRDVVKVGEPGWDWALERAKNETDYTINRTAAALRVDKYVLRNWKPGVTHAVPAFVDEDEDCEPSGPAL